MHRPRRSSTSEKSYVEEEVSDSSLPEGSEEEEGGGGKRRKNKPSPQEQKRPRTSDESTRTSGRHRRLIKYHDASTSEGDDDEGQEELFPDDNDVMKTDCGDAVASKEDTAVAEKKDEPSGGRPVRSCRKKAAEAEKSESEEDRPRRRLRKGTKDSEAKKSGKQDAKSGFLTTYLSRKQAAGEVLDPAEARPASLSSGGSKRRASQTRGCRTRAVDRYKSRHRSSDEEHHGDDEDYSEEDKDEEDSDDYSGSSRGRGRRGGRNKAMAEPLRRSSRSTSSAVRSYNEDELVKDVEGRATMEVIAASSKKPSRIRKQQQTDEDEGEDNDSDGMVMEQVGEGDDKSGSSLRDDDEEGEDEEDDEEDESDSDGADDVPLPRILAVRELTAAEWREVCQNMNTKEITKGSLWVQSDEDWESDSPELIEKFLCQWSNLSYLHCSWETEKDLVQCVGSQAKGAITRYFRKGQHEVLDWEQLYNQNYFDPQYVEIDRILGIEGDEMPISEKCADEERGEGHQDEAKEEGDKMELAEKEEGKEGDSMVVSVDGAVDMDVEPAAQVSELPGGESEQQQGGGWKERPLSPGSEHKDEVDKMAAEPVEVISVADSTSSGKPEKDVKGRRYLVKWCGLGYGDSTWEHESDLQGKNLEAHVAAFRARQVVPKEYKERLRKNLDSNVFSKPDHPPFKNGGLLKDYQWEAIRWMAVNWSQGRGSILADEMGLGKTVQSAGLLHCLYHYQGCAGPFLVVAPLSTIQHWYREFSSWTDLNTIIYGGSAHDREVIRDYEFCFPSEEGPPGRGRGRAKRKASGGGWFKDKPKFQVLVTTPEQLLMDTSKLSRINWSVLVVDEAHRLKNCNSKLTVTLRDSFRFRSTLLLTGTPLQNNTEELWTLLNFVDGNAFPRLDKFMAKFGDINNNPDSLSDLHATIKPHLLRRMKEDVEKNLPPKEETIIEVELTAIQKQWYRALYEKNVGFLFAGKRAVDGPSLMNLVMSLRLCCNHPFLIRGVEADIRKHYQGISKVFKTDADLLVEAAGKLVLLDKLLPKLKEGGHRVLIFSQFKMMLDVLEDFTKSRGYTYRRIDGDVMGDKRQQAIDEYSKPNSNVFVMLLTTRAGGVGINLTSADTVIIYDSDWNPQNDVQAQARCHRIGQSKEVKVYRLITSKTYEQAMFHRASLKLGLDQAVLHGMERDAGGEGKSGPPKLTKDEIENLLRHGAYDVFREDREGKSEEESAKFCESTIESILENKSRTIRTGGDKSGSGSGMSSFSKATFTVSDGVEVGVDDPHFWDKVVGINVVEMEEELPKERSCKIGNKRYAEMQQLHYASTDSEDSDDARRKEEEEDEEQLVGSANWLTNVWKALKQEGLCHWDAISEKKVMKGLAEDEVKTVCLSMVGAVLKRFAKKEAIQAKKMKIKQKNQKARQLAELAAAQSAQSEASGTEAADPAQPPHPSPPILPPDPIDEEITVDDSEVCSKIWKTLQNLPIVRKALTELALLQEKKELEQQEQTKKQPPDAAAHEGKGESVAMAVEEKEGMDIKAQEEVQAAAEPGASADGEAAPKHEAGASVISGDGRAAAQAGPAAVTSSASSNAKAKSFLASTAVRASTGNSHGLVDWIWDFNMVPSMVEEENWNDFLATTTSTSLNYFHDVDIGIRMVDALDKPKDTEDYYRIHQALEKVKGPKDWWTGELTKLMLRVMRENNFNRFLKEHYNKLKSKAPEELKEAKDWPTITALTKLRSELQKVFLRVPYPPPPPPPQPARPVTETAIHQQPSSFFHRPPHSNLPPSFQAQRDSHPQPAPIAAAHHLQRPPQPAPHLRHLMPSQAVRPSPSGLGTTHHHGPGNLMANSQPLNLAPQPKPPASALPGQPQPPLVKPSTVAAHHGHGSGHAVVSSGNGNKEADLKKSGTSAGQQDEDDDEEVQIVPPPHAEVQIVPPPHMAAAGAVATAQSHQTATGKTTSPPQRQPRILDFFKKSLESSSREQLR